MNLKTLKDMPPWDWPEGTGKRLLDILNDKRASESDLLLATELAGDFTVINEELVFVLLRILRGGRSETVRARAALSLGPVLEQADLEGFEEDPDQPISEDTFRRIQESLQALYRDTSVPKEVRRRVLEASVRAPQDWHVDAVRAAWSGDDEDWRLTAVFCMRFVRGFDDEILAVLTSKNPDIRLEAVLAAGNWALEAAWDPVAALVSSGDTDKPLLLAAIEAVASIRPEEAAGILHDLTDSDDEDIVEAAEEALAMADAEIAAGPDME